MGSQGLGVSADMLRITKIGTLDGFLHPFRGWDLDSATTKFVLQRELDLPYEKGNRRNDLKVA